MSLLSISLWFAAMALVWAYFDLLQVRSAAGGQPFGALAAMVLVLYAAIGATMGLVAGAVARRFAGRAAGATMLATAFTAFGLLFVAGFVNFAYLPGIAEPLSIAANAGLAVAALGVWWMLSRAAWLERLSGSSFPALAIGLFAVAAAMPLSRASHTPPPAAQQQAAEAAPNVFVIAIDSLRYDEMWTTTPRLTRLTGEAMVFDRAYAQSSWTKPSVASLFTSQYPATHQANFRRAALGPATPGMPERFAAAGYRTAVFSANPWIAPAFGFGRGVEHFYEVDHETFARFVMLLRELKLADRVLPGRPVTTVLAGVQRVFGIEHSTQTNCERDATLVGEFEKWLGSDARPSFAYVHLMSPHIPYEPPGRAETGEDALPAAEQVALLQTGEALSPARSMLLRELHWETNRHADRMLGTILDALESRGMSGNSIVVVTADHGEEFHEHGTWGHGKNLYDEVVHVPLVIRGPGIREARVQEPAMLIDVLPTLARLAGIPADESWKGTDLSSPSGARPVFSELLREGGMEMRKVYVEGDRLIESIDGIGRPPRLEIYSIGDKLEANNQSNEARPSDHPLFWLLQQHRDEAARPASAASGAIDKGTDERLKALGYLD